MEDDTKLVEGLLSPYPDETSNYQIASDLGVSEGSVRAWRAQLADARAIKLKPEMRAKLREGPRRKRKRTQHEDTDRDLAADLERIYREFDTPEDRLLARENLAAMMWAEAAKTEARAVERDREAAKIRARSLYLAQRRALLMCRRTRTPNEDGAPRRGRDEEAEQVTVNPDDGATDP